MRYRFLSKDHVYEALNKLRAALLAAKDGEEVETIIKGVLSFDERIKIGRRIQVAQMIIEDYGHDEIKKTLKVGSSTIMLVNKNLRQFPKCFEYIKKREDKVETEFNKKAYRKVGGPKLVYKKTKYIGFKRSKVKR